MRPIALKIGSFAGVKPPKGCANQRNQPFRCTKRCKRLDKHLLLLVMVKTLGVNNFSKKKTLWESSWIGFVGELVFMSFDVNFLFYSFYGLQQKESTKITLFVRSFKEVQLACIFTNPWQPAKADNGASSRKDIAHPSHSWLETGNTSLISSLVWSIYKYMAISV